MGTTNQQNRKRRVFFGLSFGSAEEVLEVDVRRHPNDKPKRLAFDFTTVAKNSFLLLLFQESSPQEQALSSS